MDSLKNVLNYSKVFVDPPCRIFFYPRDKYLQRHIVKFFVGSHSNYALQYRYRNLIKTYLVEL